MNLGLAGRRALVMGASRGLGRAIAAALLAENASVAICAREGARLSTTAQELSAHPFPADLSVPGRARSLVQDVRAQLGGLDILVVNTGGPQPCTFDGATDEMWQSAFDALWMSAVQSIHEALPAMRTQKWGRILLVTSIAAREPIPSLVLSNGLRAGLHGLANALSKEVAGDGITVNVIMPGYILTERLTEVGVDEEQIAERIPARRVGRPEELAALATFLASEKAAYITGQAIACDGGLLQSI